MGLKFADLEKQKKPICYVLGFESEQLAKLGYTDKGVKQRLSTIKFSGRMKGLEKGINIEYTFPRKDAKTIEYYAHIFAKQNYLKPMDKNLGGGYTEWYEATPRQMVAMVLLACRFVKWETKKAKNKIEENETSHIQLELF